MKSHFILMVILIGFVSQTQAQPLNFNGGSFTSSEYLIELPYQNVNDKIIVVVELKGKKRRFLLDTGAPLAISQQLFEELAPTILSKQVVRDINQKSDSLLVVRIDSLKIGTTYATGVPAIILKSNLISDCLQLDGFLGSNLFQHSAIQLDSRSQVIRVADSTSKLNVEDEAGDELLVDQQGSPFLKLRIGRRISEVVMFDSGSDVFYTMAHAKIKRLSKANDFTIIHKATGSNQMGLYGVADKEETFLLRLPVVQLNYARINNVISETSSNRNSRVGAAILHYGILTLDYKMKRYYFRPYAESTEYQSREFQISPTFIENKLCIGKIWTKELEDQVAVGDQIISVNDVQVDRISICDAINGAIPKSDSLLRMEIKKKAGTSVMLTIKRIE